MQWLGYRNSVNHTKTLNIKIIQIPGRLGFIRTTNPFPKPHNYLFSGTRKNRNRVIPVKIIVDARSLFMRKPPKAEVGKIFTKQSAPRTVQLRMISEAISRSAARRPGFSKPKNQAEVGLKLGKQIAAQLQLAAPIAEERTAALHQGAVTAHLETNAQLFGGIPFPATPPAQRQTGFVRESAAARAHVGHADAAAEIGNKALMADIHRTAQVEIVDIEIESVLGIGLSLRRVS